MSAQFHISERRKAKIALFHDPYLFLELEEALEHGQKEPALDHKQTFFKNLQNPHAYDDMFGNTDEPATRTETSVRIFQRARPSAEVTQSGVDAIVSREHLEEQLDEVLSLYKPFIGKTDWARVKSYRSEFLNEASRSPSRSQRVADRLQRLKFSLMPGERVEYNRAPAERIINELKRLLT